MKRHRPRTNKQRQIYTGSWFIHESLKDTTNDDSMTLHTACSLGRLDKVKYILKHGVSVNVRDRRDFPEETPLHVACQSDNSDIVYYLIKHGADLSLLGRNGETILHRASAHASIDLIRFLKRSGSSLNVRSHSGCTPLHTAVESGRTDVVRFLLKKGLDPNARNNQGNTPLHEPNDGVCNGLWEQLIDSGADIGAVNTEGATPLHIHCWYAASLGTIQTLALLGADINARDNRRETPLDLVISNSGYPFKVKINMICWFLRQRCYLPSVIANNLTSLITRAWAGKVNTSAKRLTEILLLCMMKNTEENKTNLCLISSMVKNTVEGDEDIISNSTEAGVIINKVLQWCPSLLNLCLIRIRCVLAEASREYSIFYSVTSLVESAMLPRHLEQELCMNKSFISLLYHAYQQQI